MYWPENRVGILMTLPKKIYRDLGGPNAFASSYSVLQKFLACASLESYFLLLLPGLMRNGKTARLWFMSQINPEDIWEPISTPWVS